MPILNGIRFKGFAFPVIFWFTLAILNTVFYAETTLVYEFKSSLL